MGWGIDLKKPNRLPTQKVQWQLFLSYLTVMLTILGISAVGVYQYTRLSLYELFNQHLEILAQAASHNLLEIKSQYIKLKKKVNPNTSSSDTQYCLDHDGDLDIPWEELSKIDQDIEWFDEHKQLLGKAGTLVNKLSVQKGYQTSVDGKIRALTLPTYHNNHLEGYVRVTQLTQDVETILSQLHWGLLFGGFTVLGITGLSGIWLTKQSLKPIEQSFQKLKQFTADAAHELRSPLAAVKTSIQVMQCYPERLHPQELRKIEAIASATDRTIKLVEDLLLLARMDENYLTGADHWTVFPLEEILDDLVELLQSSAQQKDIVLESNLLKDLTVKGNAAELSRLFRNLLENALHYTPVGGKVILTMKRNDENVLVSIEDTGIGIQPEHLQLIFDRLWRADQARSRRENGLGMGLSIGLAILQRHQGKITVSSKVGVGSRFTVCLPLN